MKRLLFVVALTVLFFKGVQAQDTVRTFSQRQVVEPYRVEVAFNKTLHILFPSEVVYVDLGSSDLIADKADGAQNVVRIKAAKQDFTEETKSLQPMDAFTLSRQSTPRIRPNSISRWKTGCTKILIRTLQTGKCIYVSMNYPGRHLLR